MKENKYDDEKFFLKYAEMNRSKKGLEGAGEWCELKKVLPDFKGKKVLDLGCGYGWHCKYAEENGADYVLGVDISEKMIDIAKEKNSGENIKYLKCAIEDFNFENESFDIVISSLVFHYVKDFKSIAENIYKCLKPGGNLVFSAEHPVFTSYGNQDWIYDEKGNISHFPVDNYFAEGERKAIFLGEEVVKYHRTLTAYLDTLLRCGFTLKNITEPKPPENMMHIAGMKDELRRPIMLIVSAKKSL